MKNINENRRRYVPFMYLDIILALLVPNVGINIRHRLFYLFNGYINQQGARGSIMLLVPPNCDCTRLLHVGIHGPVSKRYCAIPTRLRKSRAQRSELVGPQVRVPYVSTRHLGFQHTLSERWAVAPGGEILEN
jgi:hypothetical protein